MFASRVAPVLPALFCVGLAGQGGWPERVAQTRMTLVEAAAKGRELAGGGVVVHAELEVDDGRLVYSIDLTAGAHSRNVVLDAASGEVVEDQLEREDHSAEAAAAGVDLAGAVAAVLAAAPGHAIEAELGLDGGKAFWSVSVLTDGKVRTARVDGSVPRQPVGAGAAASDGPTFTETFVVEKGELGPTGRNPFFVLEPGFRLVLEGVDGEDRARIVITVLEETRTIDGVLTRAVREHETENGELKEISTNFFAISSRTNDVYYFGEEVDIYDDGRVVAHDGAWMSGVDGARFGLQMPGSPLLGARYYQEIAPGVAMDRATVLGLAYAMDTPAGRFERCLRTLEGSAIEAGEEHKTYAPGIGLIQDEFLRLVSHGKE